MEGALIAETGTTGEVEWVWVRLRGDRAARPYDALSHGRLDPSSFQICGAPRLDIEAWLDARKPAQRALGVVSF